MRGGCLKGPKTCVAFAPVAFFAAILFLLTAPAAATSSTISNASGRYDSLVLRDLGGQTAALVSMAAAGSTFSPVEVWRSASGAFDVRKAKFVAGDVNGDGIGDGIVLYDLGRATARLDVYLSDGSRASPATAWTSRAGALAVGKAKLAVGDVSGDGRDDVIMLYDRGKAGVVLYRFVSQGSTFSQTTGWSAPRGALPFAASQLAAGDFTGDGRDDAVLLSRSTTASSRLTVFVTSGARFVKRTFWSGSYRFSRVKLAAGDVNADGRCDVVCLYGKSGTTGRLDAFRSTGRSFKRVTWYDGNGSAIPGSAASLAVGDVSGDGRADAVIAHPVGRTTRVTVYQGGAAAPRVWWQGDWTYSGVRLAVTPFLPTVVSNHAKVMTAPTLAALKSISPDGVTLTFASHTAQLNQLKAGDVLITAPGGALPQGVCRKVVTVSAQGESVVVTTVQGRLEDVLRVGEVAIDKHILAGDLSRSGIVSPGVTLSQAASAHLPSRPSLGPSVPLRDASGGIGFDLNITLLDTVELQGSVTLDPEAYVSFDVGWDGLNHVAYTQVLNTTTELTATLRAEIQKEIKQKIYEQTLGVITVMVGPVPVWVTPEFEVYVGASGKAAAGVTAGVTLNTTTAFGIEYTSGHGWGTTQSFTWSSSNQPPQLFGSLELKAFAGAGLSFNIYSVAGPEAKLEAFAALNADTSKDPWWKLSAGLDAEIGVKVEALGYTLAESTFTLHLFEYVIDQASGRYETPGVEGRIVSAVDGTAIPGAGVELHRGTDAPTGPLVSGTTSSSDGSFAFADTGLGGFTVVASKAAYFSNRRSVTVASGRKSLGQDVALLPFSAQGLDGRTVSAVDGQTAVAGAAVEIHQGADAPAGPLLATTVSGTDGFYLFNGLQPGDYTIVAAKASHFGGQRNATVSTAHITHDQDVRLTPYSAQGVTGHTVSTVGGSVVGATVELREGWDEPSGPLVQSTTSGAGGGYSFTGVLPGYYTVVGKMTGYVQGDRTVRVQAAQLLTGQDVALAPAGSGDVAMADGSTDHINWATDVPMQANATYELWFRPASLQAGNIAQATLGYGNWPAGGDAELNCPIVSLVLRSDGKVGFGINQYDGGGPGQGTWHWLSGSTVLQIGHWYHLAAQNGSSGMRLFVGGHLETSDPYSGAPQADWSNGTLFGGWFNLGENENHSTWTLQETALGQFKLFRVSSVQRYAADFTPPVALSGDGSTVVLDALTGGTNGSNHGFVWAP
jgi:hypothetical protein